jgi:nucleoside-diphosphate-sugar epimerase
VRRFVAQSVASSRYAREGRPIKTEDDPLDPAPPENFQRTAAALTYLERVVTDFGGLALRYGVFYGAANDAMIEPVRKRQFPIIGDGGGIWPWIHLDDAAAATVLALEHEGPAVYNIVDNDPAPVREWLPVLAQSLDAKPPRRLPTWLARPLAGEAAVVMLTEARGASNAKAKRELGWTLRHPSWRQGFVEAFAKTVGADIQAPIARLREGRPPAIRLSMTQSQRSVARPPSHQSAARQWRMEIQTPLVRLLAHVPCGTIVGGFASLGG